MTEDGATDTLQDHRQLLLEYNEFSANALAQQLQKLQRSSSWRITEVLRVWNARLGRTLSMFSPAGEPVTALASEAASLIRESGLFDERFYRDQLLQRGIKTKNAAEHFVVHGWKLGLKPNFFFDCDFYREQAKRFGKDVKVNPLLHYVLEGGAAKIRPSRLFDPCWYSEAYPDVVESKMDPLAHFLRFGLIERRLPMEPSGTSIGKFIERNRGSLQPFDVVVCIHQATRTGAPMLGLKLLQSLRSRGLNCLTVLMHGGDIEQQLYAAADTVDLSAAINPVTALQMHLSVLTRKGRLKPDTTVIANSAETAYLLPVLKRAQLNVVTLIHEFLSHYPRERRAELETQSDEVIFSSNAVLADAQGIGFSCAQPHVIPQGLLEDSFGSYPRQQARQFLRETLGIPADAFVVLACATVEPRKGPDLFVQVAKRAIDSCSDKEIHFVWVGGQLNSPAEALRWAHVDVHRQGLVDRVHFVGHQDDVEPYFAAADVFLLPSRQDALPCVLHLAMAAALPVVAFAASGGAEEVLSHGGGRLVPYGDTTAMADAVIQYLLTPEARHADGQLGRQTVRDTYDFDKYVDGLFAFVKCDPNGESSKTDAPLSCSHTVEEVEAHYERHAETYLRVYGSVIQAYRTTRVEETLQYQIQRSEMQSGMRVLDAGCGVAGPAMYFADKVGVTVDAVTISRKQAEQARAAVKGAKLGKQVSVHVGDYHELPALFPKQQFDLVMFLESLCHSPDYGRALTSAHKVLKPGGKLFIKDFVAFDHRNNPEQHAMQKHWLSVSYPLYSYSMIYRDALVRLVEHAGFRVKSVEVNPFAGREDTDVGWMFEEEAGISWRQGQNLRLAESVFLLAEKL